jgi:hypothetical protein
LEFTAILTAFGTGGILGSVVTHLLKDHLSRQADRRKQRMETDRATYAERVTRLVVANLCAFIRSDRYRDGERESLADLIDELAGGAHRQRFLDKNVQECWVQLLEESVESGQLRLSGAITEKRIAAYITIWEQFIAASRQSFGPISETDRPSMRMTGSEAESLQGAA